MTTRSKLLSGALLAALLIPVTASAGTLQVRDPSDMLTAQDEAGLRDAARAWPFDARVVVTSEMPSRASLDRYVGAQVSEPNMVVVGVDPTHRFTSVHFGTGTRIARDRFSAIENAGDQWFRAGQWRSGVEAIFTSANGAVGSAAAGEITNRDAVGATSNREAPSFPWGLMLLGIGGVIVVVMVFRAMRNRQAMGGAYGGDPYRAQQGPGPYGQPGGYPPGYGPNYGPGYGPQQGSGLGAGLIGAGLGGVAGYALGSAMANRDEHHGSDYSGGSDHSSSNYDAGGSSSGWDGGGGDFGGGDAGGGGGDW